YSQRAAATQAAPGCLARVVNRPARKYGPIQRRTVHASIRIAGRLQTVPKQITIRQKGTSTRTTERRARGRQRSKCSDKRNAVELISGAPPLSGGERGLIAARPTFELK